MVDKRKKNAKPLMVSSAIKANIWGNHKVTETGDGRHEIGPKTSNEGT